MPTYVPVAELIRFSIRDTLTVLTVLACAPAFVVWAGGGNPATRKGRMHGSQPLL